MQIFREQNGWYIYSQYYAFVFLKNETQFTVQIYYSLKTHTHIIYVLLCGYEIASLNFRFWSFCAATSTPETYFPWKVTFYFARSHLNEPTTCLHLCFHLCRLCCRAWHRNTAQMGKSKWVQKNQTVGGQLVLIIAPSWKYCPMGLITPHSHI